MANPNGNPNWKKGVGGNPKGRPPILDPELRKEIDTNRNGLKRLILLYFNLTDGQFQIRQRDSSIPMIEKTLGQIIERMTIDGDMVKFKMLLEIVLGRLPEEQEPFHLETEEKAMVLNYRKKLEDARRALGNSSEGSSERSASSGAYEVQPNSLSQPIPRS